MFRLRLWVWGSGFRLFYGIRTVTGSYKESIKVRAQLLGFIWLQDLGVSEN